MARDADLATDTVDAISAAMGARRGVATLVLPVDLQSARVRSAAWPAVVRPAAVTFDAARVEQVANLLLSGHRAVLLMGARALSARGRRASRRPPVRPARDVCIERARIGDVPAHRGIPDAEDQVHDARKHEYAGHAGAVAERECRGRRGERGGGGDEDDV
ncbi:hypothetical protein [Burkholderia seminalis]|uniref:hypothetical protein n=1 Tax=Burkholderia seminalis TaxID=488731 RepID=UPI003CC90AB5